MIMSESDFYPTQVRVLPHPHLLRPPGGRQGPEASQRPGRVGLWRLQLWQCRQSEAHRVREDQDPAGPGEGSPETHVLRLIALSSFLLFKLLLI